MNTVRKRVLSNIEPYKDYALHRDLMMFTVGAEYFTYDHETDTELEADFDEVIVVVEKDWLFESMKEDGIENPLLYLQNEYTWDDSYAWFEDARTFGKVVSVSFY